MTPPMRWGMVAPHETTDAPTYRLIPRLRLPEASESRVARLLSVSVVVSCSPTFNTCSPRSACGPRIGVTLVAGLMRGFAGFGSAMLMAPIFAILFGSADMVVTVVAIELVVSLQLFPQVRQHADWKTADADEHRRLPRHAGRASGCWRASTRTRS